MADTKGKRVSEVEGEKLHHQKAGLNVMSLSIFHHRTNNNRKERKNKEKQRNNRTDIFCANKGFSTSYTMRISGLLGGEKSPKSVA
jgi:hypothetical protein